MSLKCRVEKAKKLRVTKTNKCYHTWGSTDDHYEMCLSSSKKNVVTPDGYLEIPVFHTQCNNRDKSCYCQGNSLNTVCYHSMAAIARSFEEVDRFVSFCKSYHDAIKALPFGGYIAKIVNNNGRGHLWCTVRKAAGEKQQELNFKLIPIRNLATDLMRGNEDEGID